MERPYPSGHGNGDKNGDGIGRPYLFQDNSSTADTDLVVVADIDDRSQKSKRPSVSNLKNR